MDALKRAVKKGIIHPVSTDLLDPNKLPSLRQNMASQLANAIRFLSMDAVQQANSGHPGAPMGMTDIAQVLWTGFLQHSPNNPKFYNRDRFVLSNGHASMLLYSVLHLSGYPLTIDDLKNFRQLNSKTPGHPEYGYTAGVETTTGPLGQGLANAVGFALAEQTLAAQFNRDNFPVVDHYTYVFVGDGCLMEGISHEAASLAGTLGLGKLIVFYDDNGISIDGKVDGWFSENIPKRFEAYGWHVVPHVDGHDAEAITNAIKIAQETDGKPTIICCKTLIGKGSASKEGSHKTHGSPLGSEEIAATRKSLGWNYPPFEIPQSVYDAFDAKEKGEKLEAKWNDMFSAYSHQYPELASELIRRLNNELPANFDQHVQAALNEINTKAENIATRKASQNAIEVLAQILPEMVGGSADLTPSNLTDWSKSTAISKANKGGNYIHYGVREFAMCAIMNGLTLHGGIRPFGATFLMFSEYARNALRMAALMKINTTFVFTHDSIGVGEDGPTHQPVEQTATLRMIPNMAVWRPCDTAESLVAWAEATKATTHPSCLIFSRQTLPFVTRDVTELANIAKGGYVLREAKNSAQAVLIATGSEVSLALKAQEALQEQNIHVRVVSMPSTNVFDKQDASYQQNVLPKNLPRIAIEAGVTDFWRKYVGLDGAVIGLDHFGESAPAELLFKEFGITVERVIETVKELI